MKKCKFCRQVRKLSKRVITLPTGLEVTSIDPMCNECYTKLKQLNENNHIQRDTHTK